MPFLFHSKITAFPGLEAIESLTLPDVSKLPNSPISESANLSTIMLCYCAITWWLDRWNPVLTGIMMWKVGVVGVEIRIKTSGGSSVPKEWDPNAATWTEQNITSDRSSCVNIDRIQRVARSGIDVYACGALGYLLEGARGESYLPIVKVRMDSGGLVIHGR